METFDQYPTPQDLNDSHQRSSSEQRSQRADEVLAMLYDHFGKIYKHAWTSQNAWEDRDVWARELRGISMQGLERGFQQLRENEGYKTFPPNPIEFYHLCKPPTTSPDGINAAAYIEHKPEPSRLTFDSRRELAQRKTNELRAMLNEETT